MATDIKLLVQKAIDNRWNLCGLAVGFLTGSAGLLFRGGGGLSPDITLLAATFIFSFFGLLIYLFMHLHALREATEAHAELERERREAVHHRDRMVEFNSKADEAFTNLSRARTRFDGTIVGAMAMITNGSFDRAHLSKATDRALKEFMIAICDAAVEAISARKMMNPKQFQANIKLITAAIDNEGPRYSLYCRSTNTTQGRLNTDRVAKTNYIVEKNGYFNILRHPGNTNRFVNIDDIDKKLEDWRKDFGEAIQEPTQAASNYYKACLAAPIMGELYDSTPPRPYIKAGDADMLIGALFIDSKDTTFDTKSDLTIMEELSINAYSAIRSYDWIKEAIARREEVGRAKG